MSYFQTRLASLPSFHFFHSSPKPVGLMGSLYLGRRCVVNGVLTRHWTDPPPPSQPPPRRYSAHTLCNIYLKCDFFSPLVPFLCLTCLPSLNQYGWLDNFTGSLTPKGTPERESPTPCPPVCSRSVALTKLRSLRCSSGSGCTVAASQHAALVDAHWCMAHIYELVISCCSAHSSNPGCQPEPLPYPQTVCLSLPPPAPPTTPHTHTLLLTLSHMDTCAHARTHM